MCLCGRQKEKAYSVKAKLWAALVFCQCARIASVHGAASLEGCLIDDAYKALRGKIEIVCL